MIKSGLLKEHSKILASLMWALDLVIPALSAWVAFTIHPDFDFIPQRYLNAVGLALIGFAIVFPNLSFGKGFRGMPIMRELRYVVIAVSSIFISIVLIALFTKSTASYSRIWLVEWYLFTLIGLIGYRVALRLSLRWFRSQGFNQRDIVVVGSGDIARTVIARLLSATWSGFRVVAIFTDDKQVTDQFLDGGVVKGHYDDVEAYVQQSTVDQVWMAMPLQNQDQLHGVMESLKHCTADIRYVPDIFEFQLFNHSMSEVAGLPVLNLTTSPMDGVNRVFKALEDRVLAFIILLLASPFFLAISIAIKMSSKGPVYFKQDRVGWNGKHIEIVKFRTMPVNVESSTGPVWASPEDSRATRVGRFLRRTSLDELPQFYNVLRGDMSIVGPRPERPMFVEKFKEEIPHYMKKHMVKAGITGWAQVNGWRGNTSLNERVKHDLYYIENWSVAFDLKIILLTFTRGFINKNAY